MALIYLIFFVMLIVKIFGGNIAWWEVMIPLWMITVGAVASAFLNFLENEKKNV